MQRKFSDRSLKHMATCDPKLIELAYAVLNHMDIIIVEGYRSPEDQVKVYRAGLSKLLSGKHNVVPSRAIHFAPYPYQEKDVRAYYYLGGLVKGIAAQLGIPIRWGGDWDSDGDIFDQTFNDLMHFEMMP